MAGVTMKNIKKTRPTRIMDITAPLVNGSTIESSEFSSGRKWLRQ